MDNLNENNVVVEKEEPVVGGELPLIEEAAELAGSAFGNGLAATIMANFPITSIISIFLGIAGLRKSKKAKQIAEENKGKAGGKNTAAKILSIIGIAYGGYMTLFWAIYSLVILLYVVLLLIGIASGM